MREKLRNIWKEKIESEAKKERHLTPTELYSLLIEGEADQNKAYALNHLAKCGACFGELKEMLKAREETKPFDVALPKAAATGIGNILKVPTEGGKYTIVLRRYLKEKDKGVITLEVEASLREELEGKQVLIKDKKGRLLLEGKIVAGQVSQRVKRIDDIDYGHFFVQPII